MSFVNSRPSSISGIEKSINTFLCTRQEENNYSTWIEPLSDSKKKYKMKIVIGNYNIFFFKRNGRIFEEGHILELVSLRSTLPLQIGLVFKRFSLEIITEQPLDADNIINSIRICYAKAFPAIPEAYRFKLEVEPRKRLGDLSALIIAPCGAYSRCYLTLCSFFDLLPGNTALHQSVVWDADNLFEYDNIFDARKFNLWEYEPLSTEQLKAFLGPIRFSNYFKGLVLKNFRVEKDVLPVLLSILKHNAYLEQLTLSNLLGAPKDVFLSIVEALSENTHIGLTQIDFSSSLLEDKALTQLSSYLSNENHACQLRSLNISNCSISKQGFKALGQALNQHSSLCQTLEELNVSQNKIELATADLVPFFSTPNSLTTLNLSNTACALESILPAICAGCLHLVRLDLSQNKLNQSAANSVAKLLQASSTLEELNLSATQFPVDALAEILTVPKRTKTSLILKENNLGLVGARIIYSVAKAISNISALDLSDNDFKDEGVAVLAEGLCSCKGVNALKLDRNFTKGKSKNFSESIEGLSKMANSVDCSISALSITGGNKSQLKGELVPFILSLTQNTKLTSLDISGHSMGASALGATALSRMIQVNNTLTSLKWDDNETPLPGLLAFVRALKRNNTLYQMNVPISDVSLLNRDETNRELVQRVIRDIEKKLQDNIQKFKIARTTSMSAPPSPRTLSVASATDSKSLRGIKIGDERTSSEPKNSTTQPINANAVDSHKELCEIIKNKKLAMLFREFLHQCFNSENFSFWLEAEDYKHIPDPEFRKTRAQEIYKKYFTPSSTYELNIDSKLRDQIIKELDDGSTTIFEKAQTAIWTLMVSDCVPKFMSSDLYRNYKKGRPGPNPSKTRDVKFSTIRMLVSGGANSLRTPPKGAPSTPSVAPSTPSEPSTSSTPSTPSVVPPNVLIDSTTSLPPPVLTDPLPPPHLSEQLPPPQVDSSITLTDSYLLFANVDSSFGPRVMKSKTTDDIDQTRPIKQDNQSKFATMR